MRLWDKKAEQRELTDFAAVAEDLRKRRAASRESARLHPGPKVNADEVRSYEPEEHLVERRAQARRLVADSSPVGCRRAAAWFVAELSSDVAHNERAATGS